MDHQSAQDVLTFRLPSLSSNEVKFSIGLIGNKK